MRGSSREGLGDGGRLLSEVAVGYRWWLVGEERPTASEAEAAGLESAGVGDLARGPHVLTRRSDPAAE